jgi:Ca2+-binding RTX toxin-like protein
MLFANYLNRLRQHLRRRPESRRPELYQNRPRIERLEDRWVPSTLDVNAFGVAHYLASPGVANDVTLSERVLVIDPPRGSLIPIRFLFETVITDTAEKITVSGADAPAFSGSGTKQVTTLLPLKSLLVDVLDGNDTVNVQAINYATTVRHIGAAGVDTINVGEAGRLSGIQASLGVTEAGAGSSTHLNVDDSADAANHSGVLLFGGQINNLAPTPIAYVLLNSSDAVTITGGSGNNTYLVDGPQAATTLNTGSGSNQINVRDTLTLLAIQGHGGTDTVTVGSLAPSLGGAQFDIHGEVTVANTTSSTSLFVDDSGDLTPRTVAIGPNSVQSVGIGSPINFLAGVKHVDVFGGHGDTFVLGAPSPTTPMVLHGGVGANTLVSGAGVNDWTIKGTNLGTLRNVTFANVQNLRGGPASFKDTFHFNDKAGVTGSIQGAGFPFHVATLDYSKYTSTVLVNLKLNLAIAGGITTSVFNIRDVLGGQGNNILVGNGNNFLSGGNGRDILISGGGTSTLQAGAGEAILIGAHYVFDANLGALGALLAEWSKPIPYALRVHDLIVSGALNKSTTLVPQPGVTTLVSGGGLDFLIIDAGDVLAKTPRPGEVVL